MRLKFLLSILVPSLAAVAQNPPVKQPQAKAALAPKIFVAEPYLDLGKIREGDVIEMSFTVENRGDADLLINDLKSDCGCTTVKLTTDQKRVPPGESREITATFDSKDRPGTQTKRVTVFSNDRSNRRQRLTFTVEVETLFRTFPARRYDLGNARRGQALARPLDLLPSQPGIELELVDVEFPGGGVLRYDVEPLRGEHSTGKRLRLLVDPDAPLGSVQGRGKITARVGDQQETRTISFSGRIVGDVTVTPAILKRELPTTRGNQLRELTIRSVANNPVRVLGVDAGINFDTSLTSHDGNTRHIITVKISDSAADGPCAAYLTIRTDSPLQPLVRVPIFVHVAPRLRVDPPLVLLGHDGGKRTVPRRVALINTMRSEFSILQVEVDHEALHAAVTEREDRPTGVRYLEVGLNGPVDPSVRHAKVTVTTDVHGAEVLEIPVEFVGSPPG